VSRYVSIEQLIYENKNHYYDSLRESSDGWHDGTHSIWAVGQLSGPNLGLGIRRL